MNQIIPVAIACDDKYAVGVATCLYSILEKTKAFLDVVVLESDISKSNKIKIVKSLKKFKNFTLAFINTKNFHLERFPSISYYSINCFSRYFIADIFKDYDKIIYTDADVIFMDDIEKYYNIDMGGCGLAAVSEETGAPYPDIWKHEYRKKLFDIPNEHTYFANGNIIISGEYWRKNNISAKLINKTLELRDKLVAPDLDVMNIIFSSNKYKQLELKYCVCTHIWEHRNINQELSKSFQNPFIIHYTCVKPWDSMNVPFWNEYEKILIKTKFYKKIISQINRTCAPKNNFLENIFSVKNSCDKKHKIITFLGIHIKIKRRHQ